MKKENKLDVYTSEYLLQMAAEQEATAAEQEALATSAGTLPSQLGALLQKKMEEGMKTKELAKEFFEKMDKNGDVSLPGLEPARVYVCRVPSLTVDHPSRPFRHRARSARWSLGRRCESWGWSARIPRRQPAEA